MKHLKNLYCRYPTPVTLLILMFISGCNKFVEIPPPINQLTAATTFSSDATASSAIAGIYSRMSQGGLMQAITPYTGMYADELVNYQSGNQSEFALSQLTRISSPALNSNFWNLSYQYIYFANSAIEQLERSGSLSPALRSTLTGEAKFIRAYLYLNLSSLFGGVPLVLSTNFEQNSSLPRSPKEIIMTQVIEDLKDAVSLLPDQIDAEKVRANRYAAMALLARAYLYHQDWSLAEQMANSVIESKKYTLPSDLSKVFLKNSAEAILQFYPTQSNQNTPDGLTFLPATSIEQPKYMVTASLMAAFEPGDMRKTAWTSNRTFAGQAVSYPAKYKVLNTAVLSEYLMILRLSEQYLIRAEAGIQHGEVENGIADLNIIRKRARTVTPPNSPGLLNDLDKNLSKEDALLAVEKERRVELFCETGHRWLDLQRTGRANTVLGALKISTWSTTAILWPIPEEQLRLNPLLTQNAGYNK